MARDTRTLSVGEGFLVNLAQALGSGEQKKTFIGLPFLDEGINLMDGDTLQSALTALDSLNSSGKMIGIISACRPE